MDQNDHNNTQSENQCNQSTKCWQHECRTNENMKGRLQKLLEIEKRVGQTDVRKSNNVGKTNHMTCDVHANRPRTNENNTNTQCK